MPPALPAPSPAGQQQEEDDKHAYITRLQALAHTAAQVEHTLGPALSKVMEVDVQEEENEYARLQAQLAFRREVGHLKKAMSKAKLQMRQLERGQGAGSSELRVKLQEGLSTLEERMRTLGRAHRQEHERLQQQERALTKEVEEAAATAGVSLKAKLQQQRQGQRLPMSAAVPAPPPLPPLSAALEASLNALDEEILAQGGPTGGWPAEDHARFLALWQEFRAHGRTEEEEEEEEDEKEEEDDPVAEIKGNLALLERAARVLYRRSEAEVMRHLLWYVEHRRRVRVRADLIKRWKEALRQEAEEYCGGDVAAQKRKAVGKWRQQRQQEEEEKAEAQKQADFQAQQQQAAAQQKRVAWTKQQLAAHRAQKEAQERRLALERERKEQEAKEQAAFDRLMRGEVHEDSPHLLKLALARRARLSLQHAQEKRQAVHATRPERKAEARTQKQQEMLQTLAFEEALLLDEQCPADRVRRSLPRYKHRDVVRLNQATEAWRHKRWEDEELDEKDRERLMCLAHERPLPPGLG